LKILERLWRHKEQNLEEYLTDNIVENAMISKEILEKETVEDSWELPRN